MPRQIASSRKVRPGDVIATEITANFHEYPGQILPLRWSRADSLFRKLTTPPGPVRRVTRVIPPRHHHATDHRRGRRHRSPLHFPTTSCTASAADTLQSSVRRASAGQPDITLEAGASVVQPNVTKDQKAEYGWELAGDGEREFERMHRVERGLLRIATSFATDILRAGVAQSDARAHFCNALAFPYERARLRGTRISRENSALTLIQD